jgi:hypothetical protein
MRRVMSSYANVEWPLVKADRFLCDEAACEDNGELLDWSLLAFGYDPEIPIFVTDSGFVLDGNRRTEACERLGIEIPESAYRVVNDDEITGVIRATKLCPVKPFTIGEMRRLRDYLTGPKDEGEGWTVEEWSAALLVAWKANEAT